MEAFNALIEGKRWFGANTRSIEIQMRKLSEEEVRSKASYAIATSNFLAKQLEEKDTEIKKLREMVFFSMKVSDGQRAYNKMLEEDKDMHMWKDNHEPLMITNEADKIYYRRFSMFPNVDRQIFDYRKDKDLLLKKLNRINEKLHKIVNKLEYLYVEDNEEDPDGGMRREIWTIWEPDHSSFDRYLETGTLEDLQKCTGKYYKEGFLTLYCRELKLEGEWEDLVEHFSEKYELNLDLNMSPYRCSYLRLET